MSNNRHTLLILVSAIFVANFARGQQILGGSGTDCRDGWKFSASYILEPGSPCCEQIAIHGTTDVMHTDAKDGRPDAFHRFFVDPVAQTYWGYDVEVEPLGESGTARLRFKALSLRADQLPKDYHATPSPIHVANIAEFHALPPPQFPAGTFQSGEIIAIDMLKNPSTGQKVVDYIEVEFEPNFVPSKAEPRDFDISDVLLHIFAPSLRVNGSEVVPSFRLADRWLDGKLVWLAIPGRGRFLLSLAPHTGYSFQKAGVVSGFGLSFSWNGDRYELISKKQITESSGNWNLYVLAAPSASPHAGDQLFSYGEVNLIEEFFSKTQ